MTNLRELRTRVKSANSTKETTKAQELIATSHITRMQCRIADPRPYVDEIEKIVGRLVSVLSLGHPILVKREGNQRIIVLVITSDHDMCDDYNHDILKKVTELRAALGEQGREAVLYVIGRGGTDYYDFRDVELTDTWEGFSQDPDCAATHDVRRYLVDGFNATAEGTTRYREGPHGINSEAIQDSDQAHIVYAEFVSMSSQIPCTHQMLPVEPVYEGAEIAQDENMPSDGSSDPKPDYESKPDTDALLVKLLPQYVSRILFAVILEAAVSESVTRRNAVKSATDNAIELVKGPSRVTNQAHQARTTQEITEIVGGAGALDDSGESDWI